MMARWHFGATKLDRRIAKAVARNAPRHRTSVPTFDMGRRWTCTPCDLSWPLADCGRRRWSPASTSRPPSA